MQNQDKLTWSERTDKDGFIIYTAKRGRNVCYTIIEEERQGPPRADGLDKYLLATSSTKLDDLRQESGLSWETAGFLHVENFNPSQETAQAEALRKCQDLCGADWQEKIQHSVKEPVRRGVENS